MTPLELMRSHVEALYIHDANLRIRAINQWDGGIPPRFFLGRTTAGNVFRIRHDVPDAVATELERLAADEPRLQTWQQAPIHAARYEALLASHTPVTNIWHGPAYSFPDDVAPGRQAVTITQANANLLRNSMDDWLPDVPHRQPFMAMLDDNKVVAVCASVRITDAAHEAGVETLPAHRRRGHAVNVVASWSAEVRKLGATPLYSTSHENVASQNVAATLGLKLFGVDYHIT